jgi:hypothetical protein
MKTIFLNANSTILSVIMLMTAYSSAQVSNWELQQLRDELARANYELEKINL